MTAMRAVGSHRSRPHARLSERDDEYVVELDISDFTERELAVEVLGSLMTVRGDQFETTEDDTLPFHLHERLEESFRLPEDADAAGMSVLYRRGTLRIQAPRTGLEPRLVPIEHPPFVVNPDAEGC